MFKQIKYKLKQSLFILIISSIAACSGKNDSSTQTDAEAIEAEKQLPEKIILKLIPGELEIGLDEHLLIDSETKSQSEDSIFLSLEMGYNPMDLKFEILKNTDENLSIEQMEEKAMFSNNEGKTYEDPSGQKYRSKWYLLTYALENRFSFTSFKDEEDLLALTENLKSKELIDTNEAGETSAKQVEAYTTHYYIRLSPAKKAKKFILVIAIPVGC
jgi:hypothetical protein